MDRVFPLYTPPQSPKLHYKGVKCTNFKSQKIITATVSLSGMHVTDPESMSLSLSLPPPPFFKLYPVNYDITQVVSIFFQREREREKER